tara:strand:- start:604 stop:756 length:153 start_codon:yes stop_codon:yes gene_type:complete
MMTKKHFVRIADILKEHSADYYLVKDFCKYFETENPNFDKEKFVNACERQ